MDLFVSSPIRFESDFIAIYPRLTMAESFLIANVTEVLQTVYE